MLKQNLTRAHGELFRRPADERFSTVADLAAYAHQKRSMSQDLWHPPAEIATRALDPGRLELAIGGNDGAFLMNDWSFSQLCKLAGVGKETVNRLSSPTASQVFAETLPRGNKPLQLFTQGNVVRSIHGTSYTRLHDAELVRLLQEFAVDFQPPQTAMGGGTGLYAGEQDMFAFLIDPAGWAEIEGEAFAPGFFLWNSEVGRRSVGIQTFWFQAVCQNHIVWDAVEVVDFSRKHTANVHESLVAVRQIIESLVAKRDERRDGFVKVIAKAMQEKLGDDAEEVLKNLQKHGIPRGAAKEALKLAEQQGRFTIFSLVDALTRLSGSMEYAGDRFEADSRSAQLLELAL